MKSLLPIALIVFGFAQQPAKSPESNRVPKGTRSQLSQPSNSPERKEKAPSAAVGEAQTTTANEHTAPSDENVKIQGTLAKYTGLLVVVGFITALAIIWQSCETRRAAEFANRSIEAIMDKERARIEIIAGPVALSDSAINGIAVSLKNIGPTVASVVEVAVNLINTPSRSVVPDYGQCIHLGFTGSVLPNAATNSQIAVFLQPQATLTTQQVLSIRGMQSMIHFYGFARYRDVYNRIHRVQIHLQWWIHLGLTIAGQATEYWLVTGEPQENSDTEEKPPTKGWIDRLCERLDKVAETPN